MIALASGLARKTTAPAISLASRIRPSGIRPRRRAGERLVLEELLGHRRPRESGGDGIDVNAVLGPVDREGARERSDGALGRRVGGLLGQRYQRGLRGDVDDRAAALPEERSERLAGVDDPEHVDLEVPPEVVERKLLEGSVRRQDAGGVDEGVETPVSRPDRRRELVETGPIGDVASRIAVPVDDLDRRSGCTQEVAARLSDTGGTAGDDGDTALHPGNHRPNCNGTLEADGPRLPGADPQRQRLRRRDRDAARRGAPLLSGGSATGVLLKREDLQPIFSFKLRGAYNKMSRLDAAELRARGVAASAGNHAQGVALAAQRLGAPATIVMPVTTPQIKVDAVAALGATVVLDGDSYDDAYARGDATSRAERRLTFVHPYDDPDVIAGQGTIAMEILRQCREPIDAIFVAVGGGGLIAGIAAYVKRLRPEIRIVGVEPVDADAMARSLRAGRRVTLSHVGLFADGVAVKQVGEETFRLARALRGRDAARRHGRALRRDQGRLRGHARRSSSRRRALGVAGAKRYVERGGARDRTLVTILCGANMNFDRLRFVAERAELGEQREAVFAATIPERPGQLQGVLPADRRAQRHGVQLPVRRPAGRARLRRRRGAERGREGRGCSRASSAHGIRTLDLSDNEMAKLHVRHLVGGRAPGPSTRCSTASSSRSGRAR